MCVCVCVCVLCCVLNGFRNTVSHHRQASVFPALMFMAQEPQIPSRQERRNVSVGSISFLILMRASSTIGPHLQNKNHSAMLSRAEPVTCERVSSQIVNHRVLNPRIEKIGQRCSFVAHKECVIRVQLLIIIVTNNPVPLTCSSPLHRFACVVCLQACLGPAMNIRISVCGTELRQHKKQQNIHF